MKLLSMTATFGGLDHATLRLADGLNLLELPNESGKSTWCAFLQAMFYGLESRKGGPLSERARHTPWSGAPMAGSVDLLWRGRAVTLRRFGKGSNPFGGFQAVYTGTEEPVPGLTADNAGEVILGLTKEVFRRTCFIPQGGLRVDASGDLERRIAALAAGGEEDVSYTDAEGRLREQRNAIQSNRATGSLPKLRAQLADTQARRRQLLDARDRAAQAQTDAARLDARQTELKADLARHAQAEAARTQAEARRRYEAAALRLAQMEDALAEAEEAEGAAKARLPRRPGPLWPAGLALAGAGLCLVALWAVALTQGLLWLIPVSLALTAATGGAALWWVLRRKRALAAFDAAEAAWAEAQARTRAAQEAHVAARSAWEALSAQGEPPAPPKSADLPRSDPAQVRAELERVGRELAQARDRRARAQGEEAALGGLEPMEEQLAALEEAIQGEERELAALNLALDALKAANAQLQARFSPALNAQAGALLSRLTGGRYTALTFTRAFEALARGDAEARSAQLLSQGTADQVYLALRLAICLLALPGSDPPPLILDDALVCFDDARLRLCLDLLRELAEGRQILLFTCQSRERLALT